MKTPMQLLYEQLERTVIQQKGMMSIGEYESFQAGMEMAIAIIEQDGYFEKEKEVMVDFAYKCRNVMAGDEFAITHWYDKTFNNELLSNT